jgi:hypothetical protein
MDVPGIGDPIQEVMLGKHLHIQQVVQDLLIPLLIHHQPGVVLGI